MAEADPNQAIAAALQRTGKPKRNPIRKAENAMQRAITAVLVQQGRKGMRFTSRDRTSTDVEDRRPKAGTDVGTATVVTRKR